MAGSTPITSTLGFSDLATVAQPAISPPPPIGMGKDSRSGTSSNISSATVPWPAITCRSLNGWMKARSRSA